MKHKAITPLILITLIALLLSACSTLSNSKQSKLPDWVDGNSSEYPRKQYIIGRGNAEQLEIAQDRARANIAKTFEVNVHERSSDTQQHQQRTDQQGTRSTFDSHIQRQITSETDQIISGIEIAEVWQQPKTNRYYTLAILSRKQALTRLRQQISQLDTATQKHIKSSRASRSALTQAGFAAQALAAQQQRAEFQNIATVVDLSGKGVKTRWQTAKLDADLNEILNRIHIYPVSNDNNKDLKNTTTSILAGALAAAGLTPSKRDNSDYILTGQLDIRDLGKRKDWYWQRASMQIKLTDKKTGQLIGSHTWDKLKAAGLDKSTAKQRILKKVETALKKDLRQTLINMVTPQ